MNRPFRILACAIAFAVALPAVAEAVTVTFNVPVVLSRVSNGQGKQIPVNCLPFNLNPATNSGAQLVPYAVTTGASLALDSTGSFSGTVTEVINVTGTAHGYQCSLSPPPLMILSVPPVSGSM